MKRTLFTLFLLLIAPAAFAYEYHLEFTPQPGGYILTVAGYRFSGDTVVGNCSYYTQSACSGRGCHSTRTYHYNTCTWDLYGNVLNMTTGEPPIPKPLYRTGTEIVYAVGGRITTGADTRNFGFVSTPSPHYSWQTPNGGYAVVSDAEYSVKATVVSDGDYAVDFSGARVVPQVYGFYTPSPGSAVISANTCAGYVKPGATCTVTASYNPTTITCTGSPYGYAYTGIDLSLVSDAGGTKTDFTERFTVTGVPICDD